MRRIGGLEPHKERPEKLSGMQSRLCLENAAPKETLCRFQAAKSRRPYWTTQPPSTQMVLGILGPTPQDQEPKVQSHCRVRPEKLNTKPQLP